MDLKNDKILGLWPEIIPMGWRLEVTEGQIRIERSAAVYVLAENKINAPISSEGPQERALRIRTHGKPEYPRLIFTLKPWAAPPRGTLSELFAVDLVEVAGLEDELHSIDDQRVSGEVWALRGALLGSLSNAIKGVSELPDWAGRLVTFEARKAKEMSQHRLSAPPGYPFAEYIESDGSDTVAYFKEPLRGPGPWLITGRVFTLPPAPFDPCRKESVEEIQLEVLFVRGP